MPTKHGHAARLFLPLERRQQAGAVVRKYAAGPGPGPRARRARTYRMSTGLILPRRAFRPPPRVDSAVLVVRRR